jgi:hypothetical protein
MKKVKSIQPNSEKTAMPKPENIEKHKFKKGVSGNPKGRPKMPDLKEAMTLLLADEKNGKTALDAVLARLRQMAIDGNLKAAEILLDRAYGKPKQSIDHTTGGNEFKTPATIVFVKDEDTSK